MSDDDDGVVPEEATRAPEEGDATTVEGDEPEPEEAQSEPEEPEPPPPPRPRRPSGPKQRVGVVVTAFQKPEWLKECIKSVLSQALPARVEMEVVVVTHGGRLAEAEAAQEFEGDVLLLTMGRWDARGTALNVGIERLPSSDLIVIVDGCDTLEKDHVSQLLKARRPGTKTGYRPQQRTMGEDGGGAPSKGIAVAWEARALLALGGYQGMYVYAGEEMAARAVIEGVEIVEVPGDATYSHREHPATPERLGRTKLVRFFPRDRKALASALRGSPIVVPHRSVSVTEV